MRPPHFLASREDGEVIASFVDVCADQRGAGYSCYFQRQDGTLIRLPETTLDLFRQEHTQLLDPVLGNPARQTQLSPERRALIAREAMAFTAATLQLIRRREPKPDQRPPALIAAELFARLQLGARLSTTPVFHRREPE